MPARTPRPPPSLHIYFRSTMGCPSCVFASDPQVAGGERISSSLSRFMTSSTWREFKFCPRRSPSLKNRRKLQPFAGRSGLSRSPHWSGWCGEARPRDFTEADWTARIGRLKPLYASLYRITSVGNISIPPQSKLGTDLIGSEMMARPEQGQNGRSAAAFRRIAASTACADRAK
jgi:hypothetical protein